MENDIDIIIVGGGHAGCEAANASVKLGLSCLLLTGNKNEISKMSCNPAIGGLAKGHIVREIDALGGLMAKITDKTGIQFRMLNLSKGAAVWGPRAQVDKNYYSGYASEYLASLNGLLIIEEIVNKVLVKNNCVIGVGTLSGKEYFSKSVIITCGTFLNGLIHIGEKKINGGRINENNVIGLTKSINSFGILSARLKTGTPARIIKDSVDFSCLQEQKGDDIPSPFSFSTEKITQQQVSCFLTRTTQETHDLIKKNFHLSPMASGFIKSKGPRYCPSIETKIINFPEKETHPLFVEPEGRDHPNIYLNGFSNCFPEEFQLRLLQTIPGLDNCKISKPAYAIEYDYFPPIQLKNTLESKKITNLFFAGQVNGTSGYEEAAAQGLMAGINAALKIKGKDPFILKRSEAYIGVLIDDLVTKGTDEPYRMFTSRAEFRLILRQDNADERLMTKGYNLGLVDKETYNRCNEKIKKVYFCLEEFKKMHIEKEILNPYLEKNSLPNVKNNISLFSLLKRPEFSLDILKKDFSLNFDLGYFDLKRVEVMIKYEGYLIKQKEFIRDFELMEEKDIPQDFDYNSVHNLSTEAKEKLTFIMPSTLGQASRISGVSPADIQTLMIFIKHGRHKKQH